MGGLDEPLPDISTARWHTAVSEVYPERKTLGSALHFIIENLPQYIYQRGAQIFSDMMWEIAGKKPRIRQLVLTSSDYCKLYLTTVSFHARRASVDIPIDCGEDYVHVPLTVGMISRTPYLTFPKIFLSHVYHAMSAHSVDQEQMADLLSRSLGDMLHGVPVPFGSSCLSLWNLPRLDESARNQIQLYMCDCGLDGSPMEEARPVPSAFNRGFSEIDIVALFDLLSLDTILFTLNALLMEQKILLISSKFSSSFIAHLCEAFRVLMFPFDWQHVFIPFIPAVARDSLIDPVSGTPRVPLWIESALTSDHIHPLRFLEAPAPLFGGLRIRPGSTSMAIHGVLRDLFPDLNIIDIDSDAVFVAPQRVDRVSSPLPSFPKKLSQLIADRLSPIAEALCVGGKPPNQTGKDRLDRYAHWDDVLPLELFRGGRSTDSTHDSATETSSAVIGSFRRRSLARTSGAFTAPGSNMRSTSRTWLSRSFSMRQSRRNSLTGSVEPQDNDIDNIGPSLIQSAFLEAFVRVFFPYRDFLFVDPLARTSSAASTGSLFVGADRHFSTDTFLKSFERNTHLGQEGILFTKAFVFTQCWDLFVRTTALLPVCHVFDTACAFFSLIHKTEYLKYKQFGVSPMPAPQAVMEEVDTRMRPCPLNKKPKDHFFDQLTSLVSRRHQITHVMVSDTTEREYLSDISPTNHQKNENNIDVLSVLSWVLTEDLPSKFSEGNVESAKLVSVAAHSGGYSQQDVVNLREGLHLIAEEGKMESHLVHAVMEYLRRPLGTIRRHSPRSANVRKMSFHTESLQFDDSVSLWSGKSRPLMKNSGTMDESKLLGGIPRFVLAARTPQPATFLLRKWADQQIRSIRLLTKIKDVARIDYHCSSCGASKSLIEVLREGRYADFETPLNDVEFVTALCAHCDGLVCPELVPGDASWPRVRILKLPVVLYRLREWHTFPITVDMHLNLTLLLGMHAELYTGYVIDNAEKKQLRGLVSIGELIADLLSCCTGIGETSEDGGGFSPTTLAVIPTPLRSGGGESEVVSPRSDDERQASDSSQEDAEDVMPESPRERALWRVRQYRRVMREKEKRKQFGTPGANILATDLGGLSVRNPQTPVLRINVDERAVFSPTTRNPRKETPLPPSDQRPADAAPRRTRKSNGLNNSSSAPSPNPSPIS